MSRLSPLALEFIERHPSDCARILEQMETETVSALISSVKPGLAAGMLESMISSYGAECLNLLDMPAAAEIINEMKMPRAARLLSAMDRKKSDVILDALPVHVRNSIDAALRYPEHTVGSVMDSNPFCLPESIAVSEAVKRVKHLRERTVQEIFVVDDEQKLKGAVRIADLLSAGHSSLLSAVIIYDVPFLYAMSDTGSAAQNAGWQTFGTLPVVEKDNTLSGILKSSTLMHVLAEARDMTGTADVLNEMYTMTKMYWIVMAEMMNEVIGRERKQ